MIKFRGKSWFGLIRSLLCRIGITAGAAPAAEANAKPGDRGTLERFLNEMRAENQQELRTDTEKRGSSVDDSR